LTAFVFTDLGSSKRSRTRDERSRDSNESNAQHSAAPQSGKLIAGCKSLLSPRGTRMIRCPARRQIACAAVIERREFD
jgi:hypothetical protein